MRLRFLAFLTCLVLFALGSCKREQGFQAPYVTYVEIPAGINPLFTHYFPMRGLKGLTELGALRSASPAFIRLIVEEGEPDVDFIQEAYLNAGVDSNMVEMGFRMDNPMNQARNLDLLTSEANLLPFVQRDSFDATLRLRLRYMPDVTTRLRVEFSVMVESQ